MKFFSAREAMIGLGLIVLVFVVWLLSLQNPDPLPQFQQRDYIPQEIIEEKWATYISEEYDFTIKLPKDWEVADSGDSITPMISVLKPGEQGTLGSPIDIFENRTHVSIYPRGLPMDGQFAQRRPSAVKMQYQTKEANDLILRSGQVWASEFSFPVVPHSWGPFGFIWAHNKLTALVITCIQEDGEELPEKDCDPFFGDEMVYTAEIDIEDRATIEAILRSFEFAEEQPTTDVRSDVITIERPVGGSRVRSPLRITGKAQGSWFFEGSFEATLIDANGATIAKSAVETNASWDFTPGDIVPFEGSMTFAKPDTSVGQLILKKANPSGLAEHDDLRRIDVQF